MYRPFISRFIITLIISRKRIISGLYFPERQKISGDFFWKGPKIQELTSIFCSAWKNTAVEVQSNSGRRERGKPWRMYKAQLNATYWAAEIFLTFYVLCLFILWAKYDQSQISIWSTWSKKKAKRVLCWKPRGRTQLWRSK